MKKIIFNTEELLTRIKYERNTIIKNNIRYRKENSYLAYYGYNWYKMGMTNNIERREKELNMYHFSGVKIIAHLEIEGAGVFTAEKELVNAFKDKGARTKGEFVFIPKATPEEVSSKYKELLIDTIKTLRKNTFNNVRKTNNILRRNGHTPIKAEVTLRVSK